MQMVDTLQLHVVSCVCFEIRQSVQTVDTAQPLVIGLVGNKGWLLVHIFHSFILLTNSGKINKHFSKKDRNFCTKRDVFLPFN